jgi:hypothetical protein
MNTTNEKEIEAKIADLEQRCQVARNARYAIGQQPLGCFSEAWKEADAAYKQVSAELTAVCKIAWKTGALPRPHWG